MATTKNVNYTAEQSTKLVTDFLSGMSVDDLAKNFGKTTRSIVAKLSREGVYKAKERTTKTGEKVISKEEFVELIADKLECSAEDLSGLEKANKTTLERILKGFN